MIKTGGLRKVRFRFICVTVCTLFTVIFVAYFVNNWFSLRSSEEYLFALSEVLEEHRQITKEDIELVSYVRSWPRNGDSQEYITFKFKLNDEQVTVELQKRHDQWEIKNRDPKGPATEQ